MPAIKRIVLDVLKPHQPNALEFANTLAMLGDDYSVKLKVTEVDDKTESTVIVLEAVYLDFARIEEAITSMGGSVHSIDEVEVSGGSCPSVAEPN